MNKEKLLEIFEELLEEYEKEFDAAESQFGVGQTENVGKETVVEFRKKFTDELYGDSNET